MAKPKFLENAFGMLIGKMSDYVALSVCAKKGNLQVPGQSLFQAVLQHHIYGIVWHVVPNKSHEICMCVFQKMPNNVKKSHNFDCSLLILFWSMTIRRL